MGTRIRGLLVLLRVLSPALILLVVVWASVTAVGSIRDSAQVYAASVDIELAGMTAVFTEVGDALGEVGAFVATLGMSIEDAFAELANLPSVISFPPQDLIIPGFSLGFGINFPDTLILRAGAINLEVPGLVELRGFFDSVAAEAARIADDIERELSSLLAVPEPIERIADATSRFGGDVRSAVVTWLWIVLLVTFLAVVAYFSTQLSYIFGEIGRGWKMLRGREVSHSSLEQLRTELRTIEKKLSIMG